MKLELNRYLRNEKSRCVQCNHLTLHDVYEYLGLCVRNGDLMIVSSEACKDFEELRRERIEEAIQKRGWAHCVSCNRPIYSIEELKAHRCPLIRPEVYVDEVAWEEAPCAD